MAGVEAGDAKAEPTLRDRIAAAIDGVRLTEVDVKEARDYLASRWHEHVKASEERKERAWAAFLETWKDEEL